MMRMGMVFGACDAMRLLGRGVIERDTKFERHFLRLYVILARVPCFSVIIAGRGGSMRSLALQVGDL